MTVIKFEGSETNKNLESLLKQFSTDISPMPVTNEHDNSEPYAIIIEKPNPIFIMAAQYKIKEKIDKYFVTVTFAADSNATIQTTKKRFSSKTGIILAPTAIYCGKQGRILKESISELFNIIKRIGKERMYHNWEKQCKEEDLRKEYNYKSII
ncbi:MAG TPA: hypothetical protein VJK51_05555 [Candidatus Nanoarchaeia archaeon]|nr:hypothetical protein [Candidatus Nanoarchaeia archaeon]